MEIFKIVKDNKKSIRETSKPVAEPYSEERIRLVNEMIEYLIKSQDNEWSEKHNVRSGVGIAAPQIGINETFFAIYYVDEENKEHKYGFINPKILSESTKMAYLENGEGCLSVDQEHAGYIYRHNKITFKAFNTVTMKEETHTFTGYEAIVFQHEYDHLRGVLFYDHINKNNPFYKDPNAIVI